MLRYFSVIVLSFALGTGIAAPVVAFAPAYVPPLGRGVSGPSLDDARHSPQETNAVERRASDLGIEKAEREKVGPPTAAQQSAAVVSPATAMLPGSPSR